MMQKARYNAHRHFFWRTSAFRKTHGTVLESPAIATIDPALTRRRYRNFILLFMDFALFGAGMSLIGSTTVVPDFVSRLTNSDTLIGLAGSSYAFAWLIPQLLIAQYITRRSRRKSFLTWTVI